MQLRGCIPKSCVAGVEIDLCKQLHPITLDTKYETLVVDYTFQVRMFWMTPKQPLAHMYISQYTDEIRCPPPIRWPAQMLKPCENLAAVRLNLDRYRRPVLELHIVLDNDISCTYVHSLSNLAAGRLGGI